MLMVTVATLPVAPRVPAELRQVRFVVHVLFWRRLANAEVSIVWQAPTLSLRLLQREQLWFLVS
ncbi:hypothetical protein Hanom_Chr01g00049491 [Helianthus anomalus]